MNIYVVDQFSIGAIAGEFILKIENSFSSSTVTECLRLHRMQNRVVLFAMSDKVFDLFLTDELAATDATLFTRVEEGAAIAISAGDIVYLATEVDGELEWKWIRVFDSKTYVVSIPYDSDGDI